jgi:nitrogen fixation protein FixH
MRRPGAWPLGITAILLTFASANLWMMHVAGSDPSFAVEPDYYQKAVAFDSTMAAEARSARLGWNASSVIAVVDGGARVAVTLRDSAGQPVTGARVSVDARFNARANDVLTGTLAEDGPGTYSAPLKVGHGGEWEVRVDAVRGEQHFVTSTRAQAPSPK